jgi:hypothetical protein
MTGEDFQTATTQASLLLPVLLPEGMPNTIAVHSDDSELVIANSS